MKDAWANGCPSEPDWVGCLVLICAPSTHLALVSDAVRHAQESILGDPVLDDIGLVFASDVLATCPSGNELDPLADLADSEARRVYEELVRRGKAAARTFTRQVAFGILMVHPQVFEADATIRRLASSAILDPLPIIFRSCAVEAQPHGPRDPTEPRTFGPEPGKIGDSGTASAGSGAPGDLEQLDRRPAVDGIDGQIEDPTADSSGEPETMMALRRAIIATLNATALEVDRRPDFRIDILRTPTMLTPRQRWFTDADSAGTRNSEASGDSPSDRPERATVRSHEAGAAASLLTRQPAEPAVRLDLTPPTPTPGARRMALLHIVTAADVVTPSREIRKQRAEVGIALVREAERMQGADPGCLWHIRLFSANETLHHETKLPRPGRRNRKRIPERWGGEFDLCECAPELTDWVLRDIQSFERRGITDIVSHAVVLAGEMPLADSATVDRYRELCEAATVTWILFTRDRRTISEAYLSCRSRVFFYHGDIVNEIVTNVLLTTGNPSNHAVEPAAERDAPVPDVIDLS